MASVPTVEAALSAPRLPNNLSDDEGITGKVGPIDSGDEIGTPRDTVEENGLDEDEDDLFGDGGDDDEEPAAERKLDDEDLDSGDDEGRTDRIAGDGGTQDVEEQEQQTFNFMDADIARHAIPEPSDGELYLLKVPKFLSIEPVAFNHKTFVAPTTDHHSKGPASDHFSAYNTAMTTVRWRRSPTKPSELQSNARVLRWSDGSLTLQFASEPLNQYELNANMLAPPQVAPKIPTPTALKQKPKNLGQYKESYTYLVAPYEEANVMRVTNKFTTALSVVPTATTKDTALEELQSALAAAATRGRDAEDQAISFVSVTEDPELVRAREEAQFKEKQKQARAKEKHLLRQQERASRTMGRSGIRTAGYGLSLGGLEDEDGSGRKGASRKPKTGLRRDWSDDEDYGIRGRTREDEYDEEDDFIARSDEEPEIVEDEDDEDEGIEESPRRGRDTQSPKRVRAADEDDEVVVNRAKRRRVVEEDEDDDE